MTTKDNYYKINEILLESKNPSKEILALIKEGKLEEDPFNLIKKLSLIDQNKKYHPEGNVLNHVLLVVDEAAKNKELSKDKEAFMWAALLHDMGKLTTTRLRKGRLTSYNHDVEGEKIAYDILDKLGKDEKFKTKVSKLVRYHMQPLFFDKNLPFFDPSNMLKECDYEEVALLSKCDRLGRGGLNEAKIKEECDRIENFRNYCKKVSD
ncbi:HD domain-containing protein [Romboutsia ilealis]|uniref:HD domain-containing protein n=1 Tax=Romboutsia faecis TaxID=2764597 RepID=A0ABR7JPD0_9FIRM|nr:HD domain-containing protein [Romboutsia faecis]MBC5996622.1 HD domain-containing protein [Romboutsia faecis]MRN24148.1 HD domain-containing protein [Romboutsia ilealis]